jgi:hypothetical protein
MQLQTALVAPDAMINSNLEPIVIYFSSESTQAQLLHPISDAEFTRLAKLPEAERISLDFRHLVRKGSCPWRVRMALSSYFTFYY